MSKFIDTPRDDDDDDDVKQVQAGCNCRICSSSDTIDNYYTDYVCLHSRQHQEKFMENEFTENHSKAM